MLLHNQRAKPVSWEALGVSYEWDAYGACEVPDNLVPLLKSEGFPVDVAPVPPRAKAETAAASLTEDAKTAEIGRLRRELSDSEGRAGEAKRASEAADMRATSARADADRLETELRASEETVRALKSDATEYEKLLVESNSENAKLKEHLKSESAKHHAPAKKKE